MTARESLPLPTGTITLLLTDVEGSTTMWEADPDSMATSVARHYELLDEAITRHGGVRPIEQGEGDSVVGAFTRASDAVDAALDAQLGFATTEWPEHGQMRVRMALHTGEIRLRDAGNYFGPTIIRCARIRGVGHGGQTLVSDVTHGLVVDTLPARATMRDLGTHRLKGLGRAERIWQLDHRDLAGEFPVLHTSGGASSNLPSPVTSFLGRTDELAAVRDALATSRLVTLTGAGGCGKTQLALHVAAIERDSRAHEVWWVQLAAVQDRDGVLHAVAGVFGLQEEFGRPFLDTIVEQLAELDALVVIDNCEHVLADAGEVVSGLLVACPQLQVLATSREPLGIAGELVWRTPSLEADVAAALFVERARLARHGFASDADDNQAISQIVIRLDGIPLAIELAAARVGTLSPREIAGSLDHRFRLLTGGDRSAMPRQKTLEASIAWSDELLQDDERRLACRLSVLSGFDLDAAVAVGAVGGPDALETIDLVSRLVDKSLLQVDHAGARPRYRMLESVRQYFAARLDADGGADGARGAHFDHFLAVAESLAPHLAFGEGPALLARLEADHPNLDVALEWGDAHGGEEGLLRLTTALALFFELRGHLAKGGRWFARALRDDDAAPSSARARAMWGASHVALYGGDFDTLLARGPACLAMADEVADLWAKGRILNTLGFAQLLFDPKPGAALLAESIALGEAAGDDWAVADGWKMSTVAPYVTHDEAAAAHPLAQLRRVAEPLDGKFFMAWYHTMVGYFAAHRGDFPIALAALEHAGVLADAVGDPSTGGIAEAWRLDARAATGDPTGAAAGLQALVDRASATGSGLALFEAASSLANIMLSTGDAAAAIAMLEPIADEHRGHGVPLWLGLVLRALGEARRCAGDLEGASADLDEAATLAAPITNDWFTALLEHEAGLVAVAAGDAVGARERLTTALGLELPQGLRPAMARTTDALGGLALDHSDAPAAARWLGSAASFRSATGLVVRPVDEPRRVAVTAEARAQLGDEGFEREWARGADAAQDGTVLELLGG